MLVNSFKINGKNITDPKIIAEAFNDFYINVGPSLDAKIPHCNTDPTMYIKKQYNVNIFITPTDENEIKKSSSILKMVLQVWTTSQLTS